MPLFLKGGSRIWDMQESRTQHLMLEVLTLDNKGYLNIWVSLKRIGDRIAKTLGGYFWFGGNLEFFPPGGGFLLGQEFGF